MTLGRVTPLARRLPVAPDPLALFAALTDEGRRPDTLLLESADRPHGERSILVPRCALRMTGRGQEVEVRALTSNGRGALAFLKERLEPVESDEDSLRVRFPHPPRAASERERLLAPSPLDALRVMATGWTLTSRPSALPLLAAGVFAYDLLDVFELLPPAAEDPHAYPDFVFWLPEVMLVVDHREHATTVLAHVYSGPQAERAHVDAMSAIEALSRLCEQSLDAPLPPRDRSQSSGAEPGCQSSGPEPGDRCQSSAPELCDQSDEEYAAAVGRARRHIVAGDVFQIVPSRTFRHPCHDPLGAYARLRTLNPSPYMFYVRRAEDVLFGASPETSVKVAGGRVEIRPLAGTRPRGFNPDGTLNEDLDSRHEADLRMDEKELAEHMMLVDLARNDVARVSEAGTRRVDRLLAVDRYSHVMHLVSYVSGVLHRELDCLHAYAASMNMGTLVGAPKIRAAELLRGLEATKRGPYGGAVGYISCDGDMDTAIVIRSALVQDGVAHVRAGAGVVYDSDPMAEAMETRRKAQAVLNALQAGVPAAAEAGQARAEKLPW